MQIPELAADPALAADLSASTRSQWKAFLNVMDRPVQEVVLPPQAVDLALSIARRGMDLGILLKVYRVAADATWDYLVNVADGIPEGSLDRIKVIKLLWGRGGRWINESIERLIMVHVGEREAALHGTFAHRSETVQAILRGDPVPIDRAAEDLSHQLRAPQTCLVLWFDEAQADQTLAPLEALVQAIARELKAPRLLTHPAGRRELGDGWPCGRRSTPAASPPSSARPARATVGQSGPGLAGFRTSHREAVEAERFIVSSGNPGTVTAYSDVKLACLLAENPDASRRLVEQELGKLAADDPSLDVVRETLAHYLRHGSNIVLTSKELFVHRNTVRYRLAQAEEMVGHPLTERRTEMDLALEFLHRWSPR